MSPRLSRDAGGDDLDNPSAHGPTAQVDLLQAQRIHESHDNSGLALNGIGKVSRTFAAAVSKQVWQVNAESRIGESMEPGISSLQRVQPRPWISTIAGPLAGP